MVKKNLTTKKSAKSVKKPKAPEVKEELLLQPPRGMRDTLPKDQPYWQQVRKVSEKAAADFGYRRIDTPIVEFTNLFTRGIGTGTDIIEKEKPLACQGFKKYCHYSIVRPFVTLHSSLFTLHSSLF